MFSINKDHRYGHRIVRSSSTFLLKRQIKQQIQHIRKSGTFNTEPRPQARYKLSAFGRSLLEP
jgi:hypothetical protein